MKKKNYLKAVIHKITSPVRKVKLVNDKLKQVYVDGEKPNQMFSRWLIDIIQYGSLLEFARATMFGFEGWKSIPNALALGIMWWLWFDFLKQTKEKIKE
jgi:hypothetical protein